MAERGDEPGVARGMKGGTYYDAHSEYQRRVVKGGDALIRDAVGEMELETRTGAFTIADYGAGTGGASVQAIGTAVSAVRESGMNRELVAIHNDVPTNDFQQLFANVAGPDGYSGSGAQRVFTLAAPGSFFDQVVPSGIVDLGMCSNASHWLREQPHVPVPEGMYFSDATADARLALADQAAGDWLDFLRARAAELAPGGRMLVQGIGTERSPDGELLPSAGRLLRVMWEVAVGLADDGRLDRDTLDGYVLAVYCRTDKEAIAPVSGGGELEGELGVGLHRIEEVANPYWEMLERDGDRKAYAQAYTAFVRAFSESTMTTNLFEPGAKGADPKALSDEYFARFEAASADDPEAGRYEAWILRLVLVRRDGQPLESSPR
jgi:cyclopropane-fatty-acyl-phospholipid synthase